MFEEVNTGNNLPAQLELYATPGEAYKSYGDYNLEWLAVFACSVLSDGGPAPYYNRGYWASTMDGLHLLLPDRPNDDRLKVALSRLTPYARVTDWRHPTTAFFAEDPRSIAAG